MRFMSCALEFRIQHLSSWRWELKISLWNTTLRFGNRSFVCPASIFISPSCCHISYCRKNITWWTACFFGIVILRVCGHSNLLICFHKFSCLAPASNIWNFAGFLVPWRYPLIPISGGQAKSRGTKSRAEAGAGARRRKSMVWIHHGSA